jgi:hypothetical protein
MVGARFDRFAWDKAKKKKRRGIQTYHVLRVLWEEGDGLALDLSRQLTLG